LEEDLAGWDGWKHPFGFTILGSSLAKGIKTSPRFKPISADCGVYGLSTQLRGNDNYVLKYNEIKILLDINSIYY